MHDCARSVIAQLEDARVRVRGVSRQAFAKLRRGFSAALFDALNGQLLAAATPLIDAHRWHGLRVVAADGSRLQVAILAGCLLGVSSCMRCLTSVLDVIVRTRCRIQPGRSYPRRARTKPHVYAAYRLAC